MALTLAMVCESVASTKMSHAGLWLQIPGESHEQGKSIQARDSQNPENVEGLQSSLVNQHPLVSAKIFIFVVLSRYY